MKLDSRLHPINGQLIAQYLKDKLSVDAIGSRRFVEGKKAQISAEIAHLWAEPDIHQPICTQALYGETCICYHEEGDWAWVQLDKDGYVGYMALENLTFENIFSPSHRVSVPFTFVYPQADMKYPTMRHLPLNAQVKLASEVKVRECDYFLMKGNEAVIRDHFSKIDIFSDNDWVAIAEQFVGIPYLWGGRSAFGIDCSGLVQMALMAVGFVALRDSDMQEYQENLGTVIYEQVNSDKTPNRRPTLMRGDLIFWQGHVAIATDSEYIVHANGRTMLVTKEKRQSVENILEGKGLPVRTIRRLSKL